MDPCWGHSCAQYKDPDMLVKEAIRVRKEFSNEVLPYEFFLLELGLKKSTPSH